MTKTAVAAPAEWQDILDTLDVMNADELRVLARTLIARIGPRFQRPDFDEMKARAEDVARRARAIRDA